MITAEIRVGRIVISLPRRLRTAHVQVRQDAHTLLLTGCATDGPNY